MDDPRNLPSYTPAAVGAPSTTAAAGGVTQTVQHSPYQPLQLVGQGGMAVGAYAPGPPLGPVAGEVVSQHHHHHHQQVAAQAAYEAQAVPPYMQTLLPDAAPQQQHLALPQYQQQQYAPVQLQMQELQQQQLQAQEQLGFTSDYVAQMVSTLSARVAWVGPHGQYQRTGSPNIDQVHKMYHQATAAKVALLAEMSSLHHVRHPTPPITDAGSSRSRSDSGYVSSSDDDVDDRVPKFKSSTFAASKKDIDMVVKAFFALGGEMTGYGTEVRTRELARYPTLTKAYPGPGEVAKLLQDATGSGQLSFLIRRGDGKVSRGDGKVSLRPTWNLGEHILNFDGCIGCKSMTLPTGDPQLTALSHGAKEGWRKADIANAMRTEYGVTSASRRRQFCDQLFEQCPYAEYLHHVFRKRVAPPAARGGTTPHVAVSPEVAALNAQIKAIFDRVSENGQCPKSILGGTLRDELGDAYKKGEVLTSYMGLPDCPLATETVGVIKHIVLKQLVGTFARPNQPARVDLQNSQQNPTASPIELQAMVRKAYDKLYPNLTAPPPYVSRPSCSRTNPALQLIEAGSAGSKMIEAHRLLLTHLPPDTPIECFNKGSLGGLLNTLTTSDRKKCMNEVAESAEFMEVRDSDTFQNNPAMGLSTGTLYFARRPGNSA